MIWRWNREESVQKVDEKMKEKSHLGYLYQWTTQLAYARINSWIDSAMFKSIQMLYFISELIHESTYASIQTLPTISCWIDSTIDLSKI